MAPNDGLGSNPADTDRTASSGGELSGRFGAAECDSGRSNFVEDWPETDRLLTVYEVRKLTLDDGIPESLVSFSPRVHPGQRSEAAPSP